MSDYIGAMGVVAIGILLAWGARGVLRRLREHLTPLGVGVIVVLALVFACPWFAIFARAVGWRP